jgi:hypothetical protein
VADDPVREKPRIREYADYRLRVVTGKRKPVYALVYAACDLNPAITSSISRRWRNIQSLRSNLLRNARE